MTETRPPQLESDARRADPSRTHALVVAVDRYRATSVSDLPGLTETAAEFADWLTACGVPEENVIRLGSHATEATSSVIDEVFTDELPSRSGDLLWIFWIGHGVLDSQGRRRLLLADATDRSLRSLDLNELLLLYGSTFLSGFMRQIVVVDACQADVAAAQSVRWPEPLSLPGAGDRMIGRSQRVWLAAGAGERAAYSPTHGRAWFSDFVVENARASGELYWTPDYEVVREGLRGRLVEHAPHAVWRQQPVQLVFTSESGETRAEDIAPADEGAALFGAQRLGRDPALAAYLRWLSAVHGTAEANIGGLPRPVWAPLAESPWAGSLAILPSTHHDRRRAADFLRRSADRGGSAVSDADVTAAMSARPLPSYLTSANHIDRLDLDELEQVPARTLLDKQWRSIVLGDPGSGKTTLARRLVLREASRGPAPEDPLWRLPVLCRAADLVRALDSPDAAPGGRNALALVAAVAGWNGVGPHDPLSGDPIPPDALSHLVNQAADHRRLLLVIDGLDEVPTLGARADLVARLEKALDLDGPRYDLPSQVPGNQLMVTSRIAGYYATPLTGSVQQFILRPMDAESVLSAGTYWLHAFARATGQGDARTAVMQGQFRELAEQSDTAALASNPYLMVSLISAVASGDLARRSSGGRRIVRSDLYGFMIADALDRGAKRFPGVRRELLLDLHMALAHRIHQVCNTGVLDAPELRASVEDALAALPDPSACDADEALTYAQGLGLLTERAQGLFGFLHLTLEEHLAGRWLVSRPDAARRVRPLLGDPRWVEPVRLGLGHLSREQPAEFAALLTTLLDGSGGDHVAALLASRLGEWDAVRSDHLEAAVLAQLAADVRQAADDDLRSGPADALAPLLSSPVVLPGGERAAEVVTRVLARALAGESMPTVAAAARLADALRLDDPLVAESLYHAQFRDSTAYGWVTVRALQSMAAGSGQASAGQASRESEQASAAEVWAGLTEENRTELAEIAVTVPPRAVRPPIARLLLPRTLTPFRNALDDALIEQLESGPVAVLRVILCLYGVVGFQDTRRWITERARLEAELSVLDTPPATRHAAAVRLDTVIAPVLNRPDGDRFLDPERISVDSPLTPRLLAWIRAETPPHTLAEHLRAVAQDESEDDRTRGDALAAWLVLGGEETRGRLREIVDRYGEGVRRRLAWRMDRANLVLGDAAARLTVGSVSTALDGPASSADDEVDLAALVPRALQVLGVDETAAEDAGDGLSVSAAFVLAVYGWDENSAYSLRTILGTAAAVITEGGAEGVAAMLATAHRAIAALGPRSTHWALDPLAPLGEPTLAEALSAVDRLGPDVTFLRCWLLDQMAPLLVDRGFSVEAICLALRRRDRDPDAVGRTVRRIAALTDGLAAYADERGAAIDGPELLDALAALAQELPDAAQRERSRLLIGVLRGRPTDTERSLLIEAAERLPDPHDGLRLLEFAAHLGAVDWDADLIHAAMQLAARIEDTADRALAYARLARNSRPRAARFQAIARMRQELDDAPDEYAWFLNESVLAQHIGTGPAEHASRDARQGGELNLAAARAISVLSGTAPSGGGYADDAYIQADFVARVCGRSVDQAYQLAVFLDASGTAITRRGPLGVAQMLAAAPPMVAAFGPYSETWDLDPLSPLSGAVVPEALTAVSGISENLAFVRCWLLERMAPLLAAEGFAVEAICLALQTLVHDPASSTRTIRRLARSADLPFARDDDTAGFFDDSVAVERLAAAVDGIAQPYARNRARLYIARQRGLALETTALLDLAGEVEDPHDRLRLLELAAALDLTPWAPDIEEAAAACAARIGDRLDRALARARLARGGDDADIERAEAELAHAIEQLSEQREEGLAEPLLRHEPAQLRNENRRPALHSWAVVTCGAVCADTLVALRAAESGAASDEDAVWQALADPARRREAARALRRRGPGQRLLLTPAARRTVAALLAGGDTDVAAQILSAARANRHTAALSTWRTVPDQRIADLATLLAIETGRLDTAAVLALPRLLSDTDDRVRLRAALATSAVGRGAGGVPRFRSAIIGPRTLAQLARVTAASARSDPRTTADLWWTLSDVVHTSMPTLVGALRLLADEPDGAAQLLRGVRQATPPILPAVVDLLPELAENLRPALLTSLWAICRNPTRYGVRETDVAGLARALESFAAQASYRIRAHTLCVLGLIQEPTPQRLRSQLGAALAGGDDANPEEISAAPAEAYALGHLLARYRAQPGHDAAIVSEICDGLVPLTRSADAELSAAAVTALDRAGQLDRVLRITAPEAPDAVTVLWGLIGGLDTDQIGVDYWHAVQRVAVYIRHPPGLTGADAAHHTDRLTAALLKRAAEQMQRPMAELGGLTQSSPAQEAWLVCHLLSVLTVLAQVHRDALREAVDEHYPDFSALLVRELAMADDWLSREGASRLLLFLGHGDADTVRAILGTSLDTDLIRQRVLRDVRWFDRIRPDGLAMLLDAVQDEMLGRAYLAARMLAVLLEHHILDDADHLAALRALQRAVERSDADLPLIAEHGGQIMIAGSFGDACQRLLSRLLTGDHRPAESARRIVLDVPDAAGQPVRFYAPRHPGGPEVVFLQYQAQYFTEVEDRQVSDERLQALRAAAAAAGGARVPLDEVLALAAPQPPDADE